MTLLAGNFRLTDWLLAVFTLALVVVAVYQYLLVRRQDEHFTHTERAWLLANLEWGAGAGKVLVNDSRVGGSIVSTTFVRLTLSCHNEGRSPAWIHLIRAGVVIAEKVTGEDAPTNSELKPCGRMEPIGAGKTATHPLELSCSGKQKAGEILRIHVRVRYHDVFQIKRMLIAKYVVDLNHDLYTEDDFLETYQNI